MIDYLLKGTYQGRGLMIGLSPDGKNAIIAYFIMGRSANSRNRLFVRENDDVRIVPVDASRIEDPSLIMYSPLRVLGDTAIISNGDQTDTIYTGLSEGGSFETALRTRQYEPDAPNYTPRISGILHPGLLGYSLAILKRNNEKCSRFFYEYEAACGKGHMLHTYSGENEEGALLSFAGEPVEVSTGNDIDGFCKSIWKALNEENRISLLVRFTDVHTRNADIRIINKYA